MMKALCLMMLLVACVYAQGLDTVDRILIDNFSVGADQHSIEIELSSTLTTSDPPIVEDATFTQAGCEGLIGCSRDMRIEVRSGFNNRDFTSDIFSVPNGVFPAEWTISNPKTSTSTCTLQYDGVDNSFDLDINGLGGIDITVGGTADQLFFAAVSDIEIEYQLFFYDTQGGRCDLDVEIPATPGAYDYQDTFYLFDIDDFDNGCDLTDVGAIEVLLPSTDAVDAIVRNIKIVGDPIPSASPTRSPIPTAPSTPTPTPSPTLIIPEECMCHCPIFTCALIFDPDDDENNAYYFDDDDENEIVGSNGSINYYFGESSSSATMIQASAFVVAAIVALVL